jgi:hypothetical protein
MQVLPCVVHVFECLRILQVPKPDPKSLVNAPPDVIPRQGRGCALGWFRTFGSRRQFGASLRMLDRRGCCGQLRPLIIEMI